MAETMWVLVVWFGYGTGLAQYDAFRGGAAPIGEARYETKLECESAAKSVLTNNKHMSTFRVVAAECMAVPRPSK